MALLPGVFPGTSLPWAGGDLARPGSRRWAAAGAPLLKLPLVIPASAFIHSQVGEIPPAPAQPPPRILFGDQYQHLGGPSVQMPLWCVLDKQGAPKYQWAQGRRGQLCLCSGAGLWLLGYFPCYGFTAWPRAVRLAVVLEVAANSGVWEA